MIMRLPARLDNALDKPFLKHHNITLRKAIQFGIVSGIGAGILTGLTLLLTEKAGIWYLWSALTAGFISFVIKFVINARWTFDK